MKIEEQLKRYNKAINEAATKIAEAYSEFGDLTGYLLGQTSSTLQLSLFRSLGGEISLFALHLLSPNETLKKAFLAEIQDASEYESELAPYQQAQDSLSLFTERCQDIIASDSQWLSMQKRKKTPQNSISDPGFVVISEEGKKLMALAETLV